jgi:hypothetical protein
VAVVKPGRLDNPVDEPEAAEAEADDAPDGRALPDPAKVNGFE